MTLLTVMPIWEQVCPADNMPLANGLHLHKCFFTDYFTEVRILNFQFA